MEAERHAYQLILSGDHSTSVAALRSGLFNWTFTVSSGHAAEFHTSVSVSLKLFVLSFLLKMRHSHGEKNLNVCFIYSNLTCRWAGTGRSAVVWLFQAENNVMFAQERPAHPLAPRPLLHCVVPVTVRWKHIILLRTQRWENPLKSSCRGKWQRLQREKTAVPPPPHCTAAVFPCRLRGLHRD